MCGYRIWGLAAAFIGYLMTGFVIAFFGFNVSRDDEKTIGLIVGLGIYFAPLILIRIGSNDSSTTTTKVPNLTESEIEKIKPFSVELFQRVNAGEKMETVAQSIATRASVSPNQVISFAFALTQALKEKGEHEKKKPPNKRVVGAKSELPLKAKSKKASRH